MRGAVDLAREYIEFLSDLRPMSVGCRWRRARKRNEAAMRGFMENSNRRHAPVAGSRANNNALRAPSGGAAARKLVARARLALRIAIARLVGGERQTADALQAIPAAHDGVLLVAKRIAVRLGAAIDGAGRRAM